MCIRDSATYDRTDIILDNRISVATWGSVDLVNDRMHMVLGLPAQTLDKTMNIDGLAADYVLQIPVEGPTAKPEINWQKAGREIAMLMARKKLDEKLPGVGTLLQGIMGGQSPAPQQAPAPQTTQPSPNDRQQPQQPQPQQPADPMQQLINQGLRQIFK